jgi:hypothetical protein
MVVAKLSQLAASLKMHCNDVVKDVYLKNSVAEPQILLES